MAVTKEQVLAALRPDEPNYDNAKGLGAEALPYLREVVNGHDPMLAAKAAYLAGVIGGPESGPVLMDAATSGDSSIRAAVAGAVAYVPPRIAGPVLGRLLADDRADVRRIALQSVRADLTPALRDELERIVAADPDPTLRALSKSVLQGVRRE
jgi:HEAT repeat protein